jgi:hypothetical protein
MAKFGSLRKLPSRRWQARYTDHNTRRMISAPDTFRTKSDDAAATLGCLTRSFTRVWGPIG